MPFYAHSSNRSGQWHRLVDHLQSVGSIAAASVRMGRLLAQLFGQHCQSQPCPSADRRVPGYLGRLARKRQVQKVRCRARSRHARRHHCDEPKSADCDLPGCRPVVCRGSPVTARALALTGSKLKIRLEALPGVSNRLIVAHLPPRGAIAILDI